MARKGASRDVEHRRPKGKPSPPLQFVNTIVPGQKYDPETDRMIRKHAMHDYLRKRGPRKSPSVSIERILDCDLEPTVDEEPPVRVEAVPIKSNEPISYNLSGNGTTSSQYIASPDVRLASNVPSRHSADRPPNGYEQVISRRVSAGLKPEAIFDGGSIDPFDAAPVRMRPEYYRILRKYSACMSRSFAADTVMLYYSESSFFAEKDSFERMMDSYCLASMMSDSGSFQLLLLMAARLDGQCAPDKTKSATTIQIYELDAIHALQKAIADPVLAKSNYTVDAVTVMATYHIMTGNFSAAENDLKGLKQIVELKGGFENNNNLVRFRPRSTRLESTASWNKTSHPVTARWADWFLAIYNDTLPQLPYIKAWPNLQDLFPKYSPIQYQDSGFARVIAAGYFDTPMIDIVNHLAILLTVPCPPPLLMQTEEANDAFAQSIDDVQYCLLCIRTSPCTLALSNGIGDIQECTRLALYVYSTLVFRSNPSSFSWFPVLAKKTQASLKKTNLESCWGECAALLLWIAFLPTSVSRPGPTKRWFITLLAKVCDHLMLHNWEAWQGVLQQFLWAAPTRKNFHATFLEASLSTWASVQVLRRARIYNDDADTSAKWAVEVDEVDDNELSSLRIWNCKASVPIGGSKARLFLPK